MKTTYTSNESANAQSDEMAKAGAPWRPDCMQKPGNIAHTKNYRRANGSQWLPLDQDCYSALLTKPMEEMFQWWVQSMAIRLHLPQPDFGHGDQFDHDFFMSWHNAYSRWCLRAQFERQCEKHGRNLKGRDKAFVWYDLGFTNGMKRAAQLG